MATIEVLLLALTVIFLVLVFVRMDRNYTERQEAERRQRALAEEFTARTLNESHRRRQEAEQTIQE